LQFFATWYVAVPQNLNIILNGSTATMFHSNHFFSLLEISLFLPYELQFFEELILALCDSNINKLRQQNSKSYISS